MDSKQLPGFSCWLIDYFSFLLFGLFLVARLVALFMALLMVFLAAFFAAFLVVFLVAFFAFPLILCVLFFLSFFVTCLSVRVGVSLLTLLPSSF